MRSKLLREFSCCDSLTERLVPFEVWDLHEIRRMYPAKLGVVFSVDTAAPRMDQMVAHVKRLLSIGVVALMEQGGGGELYTKFLSQLSTKGILHRLTFLALSTWKLPYFRLSARNLPQEKGAILSNQ